MSTRYFDLASLFQQAFGYRTDAFHPELEPVAGNTDPNRTRAGAYGSPYYAADALNKEHYLPVTLIYQEGERQAEWQLPHAVISITAKKKIVETQLTGRTGTVKEIINSQDYEINVKGIITQRANELPEQQIAVLRTLYESDKPISIKNVLTDVFLLRPSRNGSDEVVIRELRLPSIQGVKNVRPYELFLVSDAPFNLAKTD